MESLNLKEENIIKDIRNLFKLKKNKITLQLKIKEIKAKAIKDRILRYINNFFQHEKEEENYCKAVRVIFGVTIILNIKVMLKKNKTLSVEEYLQISP